MTAQAYGVTAQERSRTPVVQSTADVDETAVLGEGTTVWHLAQIRENARLGCDCIVGRGAYVGPGVVIGDKVKLQNYALVYEPSRLEDGVFVGPAAVLTNDQFPRSVDVAGKLKRPEDWIARGVVLREGASVGARAVILAGCVIGRWAMIGAGAVVTRDVPDFAVVVGMPARHAGWVGRAGVRLIESGDHTWRCPQTGEWYVEVGGRLQESDNSEPPGLRSAQITVWPRSRAGRGRGMPVTGAMPTPTDCSTRNSRSRSSTRVIEEAAKPRT